jgi:F-type H+-transporting ATPase subunit b
MALSNAFLGSMTLVAENTPVIDIDGTFYIQGGLFLLLMFILHHVLFRPWLAVQDRRAERIGGAHDTAAALVEEGHGLGEDYEQSLANAREAAVGDRNEARRESEGRQKTIVDAARADATRDVEQAKERIAQDAAQARAALDGRIDELASAVSHKVIGRSA